jgi:transposase-like protein
MTKVKCKCGNEITTMKGCRKRGARWYCRKCKADVTRKKLQQLIRAIKKQTGIKDEKILIKHLPLHL